MAHMLGMPDRRKVPAPIWSIRGLGAQWKKGQADPMYSSLLVPHPATAFPRPLNGTGHTWLVTPGHARNFTGSAFGDGSGLNPRSHLSLAGGPRSFSQNRFSVFKPVFFHSSKNLNNDKTSHTSTIKTNTILSANEMR